MTRRRRNQPEPTHQLTEFYGYSEAEVDLYVQLSETYGLHFVAEQVRKEVLRQMSLTEDFADDDFWERLGAKSLSGLRLDGTTDILKAMEEWKRDVRADNDRLNCAERDGRRLKLEELLAIHKRAIGWQFFWSIRSPDPTKRARFAATAAQAEAALEAILARKGRVQ
jgi:hypothetical protein